MSGLDSINTNTTSFRAFEGNSEKTTDTKKGATQAPKDTLTTQATPEKTGLGQSVRSGMRRVGEFFHIVSPKVEAPEASKVEEKKVEEKDERSTFKKVVCFIPDMFATIFKWIGAMFNAIFCCGSCKSEEAATETPKEQPKTKETEGK